MEEFFEKLSKKRKKEEEKMPENTEKLLIDADAHKYLFKGNDLHTKDGFVSKDSVAKAKIGSVLTTNKGKELYTIPASFLDKYWKIKRGAQIIPLKDLGFITAEIGIAPDWSIVDAGSGSGGTCCFFAHLCSNGTVYSFDIREDYLKIAEENAVFLGLKNIVFKRHNIYEGIPVNDVDMVMLDLPEPWLAVEPAFAALRHGGYLVSYSPSIPQVMDFAEKVHTVKGLVFLKVCEISEKEWDVVGRKVRPKSQSIGHSGFLSFVRKV